MIAASDRKRFGRYEVVELLGAGANGFVYRVYDPAARAQVALKVLRSGLGRAADLKREFRLVADLMHPNVVLPYALETDDVDVFFTMELITGEPITKWLDRQDAPARHGCMRDAVRQIAEGLGAIHGRGLVHRDVKPSNILVEAGGRVAVLDFGLVRPATLELGVEANEAYFAGTPSYLAPEVLRGGPASAASDAYALGVILHELLTGALPYDAETHKSVLLRLRSEGRPEIAGPHADLAALCSRLLHPDPRERLSLDQVVAELLPGSAARSGPRTVTRVFERDEELARMRSALDRVVSRKRPMVLHVTGQSGMGKSALLRAFGRDVGDRAWVLAGRAYERDTVPFKALDGAIDDLAHKLALLGEGDRTSLLPSEPEALHVLFPALGTALCVSPAQTVPSDPAARRSWGARALRELLTNVAERFGLVLVLDDLHWGDLDSARLLTDVLTPPAPAVLLLLSYRSEQSSAPFLQLYRRWECDNISAETIAVKALSERGTQLMAESFGVSDPARTAQVAAEAEGCPFLIEMLLSAPGEAAVFETALAARLDALSPSARRMLEAVSLAARPLARANVPFCPEQPLAAWAAWAALVSGRLLRSDGTEETDRVEVYHDRIRDAVTRGMSLEDRQSAHYALGHTLGAAGDADGAAVHLAAAGEKSQAFEFARVAASGALQALAFDRAAQLLALALDCAPQNAVERAELTLQRARALASAGRGAEAAPLFLECARDQADLAALNLRREAMEQFLIAGRLDDGRPVMDRLLRALGVWQPRHPWLTNAVLYAEIGRLLLRGPVLRRPRPLAEREFLLLATFTSIGKGLVSFDASLGAWFFLRAARLGLDWGQPRVATRGIAYTASLLGFSGSKGDVARAEKWIAAGEAIAKQHDDAHGVAFCQVSRAMIRCCAGEWIAAISGFDAAAQVLDKDFAASAWEADAAKNTCLLAVVQTGDLPELERRANALTREARNRGDLALEVESNLYLTIAALGRNNVDEARRCIERNVALWTVRGYLFQHWIALRFRTLMLLYEGNFEEALERFDAELPRARRANFTVMQVVRIEAHDMHGRAALGAALRAKGRRRRALVAAVERDIDALLREQRAHARGPAEMLRAGLAALAGDRKKAVAHLSSAIFAYADAGMKTHRLTLEWRRASLVGDAHARLEIERALEARGVAAPARWSGMHVSMEGT